MLKSITQINQNDKQISDTVYRFMKMTQINLMRFTTIVASRIIKTAIEPLTGEDRTNVLILDAAAQRKWNFLRRPTIMLSIAFVSAFVC